MPAASARAPGLRAKRCRPARRLRRGPAYRRREGWGPRPARIERRDQPVDHRTRQERPCGVVDQHERRRDYRDRLEPGAHRLATRGAAWRDRRGTPLAERVVEQLLLPRAYDDMHRRDRRMRGQRVERARDHRSPADPAILLGYRAAGARSAAARDDQRDDAWPSACPGPSAGRLAERGLARQRVSG